MAQVVEDNCIVCGKPNSAHKALDILICGDEWRAREYLDATRKPPVLVHPILREMICETIRKIPFSQYPSSSDSEYIAMLVSLAVRHLMQKNPELWKPLP